MLKIVIGAIIGAVATVSAQAVVEPAVLIGEIQCVELVRGDGPVDVPLRHSGEILIHRPRGDFEYIFDYVSEDPALNAAMPVHTQPTEPEDLSPRHVDRIAGADITLTFFDRPDGDSFVVQVVNPGIIPLLNVIKPLMVRSGCV